jgi:cytochrome c
MTVSRFMSRGSEANVKATCTAGSKGRQLLAMAAVCLFFGFSPQVAAASSLDDPLFKPCAGCHEIGPGAANKIGPHLDKLVGRKAGTVDGFKYSAAMKAAGEGGLVWDAKTLDAYIAKPRDFIKGNRMSYRGLFDEAERAKLVAWILANSSAEPGAAKAAEAKPSDAPREFADAVLAIEGDKDFGQYLSGDCVTCHQPSGHADGIPSIVGLPKDYFVRALIEYKTNVRSNEVMKLRVVNLANEEIAALAAYFGSLEPQ